MKNTKAKGIVVYVYDVHCIFKCFPLKIMVTKTQMMVITKLQHIIISKHISKHTLFLTNTFNVAMFYIIDYIFVKQFRLILQRTNQMKVGLVFT